jgi:hypothetical protein
MTTPTATPTIPTPVWTVYGKTWNEFLEEGLANAGTLITTASCGTKLIGDISESAGTCSCCANFYGNEIITSYAVIWEGQV